MKKILTFTMKKILTFDTFLDIIASIIFSLIILAALLQMTSPEKCEGIMPEQASNLI